MKLLSALRKLNGGLAAFLKWLLVTVFFILVIDVLWGVASRYLLGNQASWSEELARLLMVWLALLGAALACREDRHLGLDVIVRQWPEDAQRYGRMFVHIAVMAFALIVMAGGGWRLVEQRFALGQTLPALGVAKAWFYLALPVSGGLITLFSAESLIAALWGEEPETEEAG